MFVSRPLILVAALTLSSCGGAYSPRTTKGDFKVSTRGSQFSGSNGYVYVVLPDPSANVVRVDVRYPVGRADDPAGKEGLAHLVEHLLFEVAIERDGALTTINNELAQHAITTNASTADDYTHYESVAAPGQLDTLMRLEAERIKIGCAGITEAVFQREKEVVLNELRQRRGSLIGLVRDIHRALYPSGHPYGQLSTLDSVEAIQGPDVCRFLDEQYPRGWATVVVSGKVDESAVRVAAARYFQALPKRTGKPPWRNRPLARSSSPIRIDAPISERATLLAWPAPPAHTHDYRMLVRAVSRTAAALDHTGSLGASSLWALGGNHQPYLGVLVEHDHEVGDAQLRDALAKAVRAARMDIAPPQLNPYGYYWKQLGIYQMEDEIAAYASLEGRAHFHSDMLQFDPKQSLVTRLAALEDEGPVDFADRMRERLDAEDAVIVRLVPAKAGGAARASRAAHVEAHQPIYGLSPSLAAADLPEPLPAELSLSSKVSRYSLANGLDVVLWPGGDLPLAHGRLVLGSGAADEPDGLEGVSLVFADQVLTDNMILHRRDLSPNVDDLIENLADRLQSRGRGTTARQRERLRELITTEIGMARASYLEKLFGALYGADHPYSRPSLTLDSIGNMGDAAVKAFAESHVVPDNATLIVAGQFDEGLTREHIAHRFGPLRGKRRGGSTVPTAQPTTPVWIAGRGEAESPTVEFDIAFLGGEGASDASGPARLVLEEILDLELAELRTVHAVTYGFYARHEQRRGRGLWRIHGEADAGRADLAASVLVSMLHRLRTDPASYRASFVRGRKKAVDKLLTLSTDPLSMVGRLAQLAAHDLPVNHDETLVRAVSRVTPADVEALIAAELGPAHQAFGVLGDIEVANTTVAAAKNAASKAAAQPTTPAQPETSDTGLEDAAPAPGTDSGASSESGTSEEPAEMLP